MSLIVREAQAADDAAWRPLWDAYLAFYHMDLPPEVTAATWARILDPAGGIGMRVAEEDGTLLGFATWVTHPSTWTLTPDCYLEDLFVDEAARGKGVGRALIEDLAALGRTKGWSRLYWHTDEGNAQARRLYDSFTPADGHVRYRVKL